MDKVLKSMDLLNVKVTHKIYGEGTITGFANNRISVQFSSKLTEFLYPDVFEKFLVAEDESIQSAILSEIENKKKAKESQRMIEEATRKAEEERRALKNQIDVKSKSRTVSIKEKFGADYNAQYLSENPILTYQQVEERFGIKITGFGRGINTTPTTIVLISSIDKKKSGFVYHDRWTLDGDYIYSGEGKIGDQKLSNGNKAIIDAAHDGKQIHLFVKFSPREYYYQGMFSLVEYTYEDDYDESGNIRKEYKFRLRKQPIEE